MSQYRCVMKLYFCGEYLLVALTDLPETNSLKKESGCVI